jgi:hypothetical protein
MPDQQPPIDQPAVMTMGILSWRLAQLEKGQEDGFTKINRRLDGLQFVAQETYRVQMDGVERRISVVEDEARQTRRGVIFSFMYPTVIGILLSLLAVASR